MRALVISSMRDEGPFIVEWVTWYRLIGFTDILVLTNDCSDHSPDLLDALQAAGWVTHVRATIPDGAYPQQAKLRRARRHPLVAEADWILICDVDEFLVIHRGEGRIGDLLPAGDAPFTGMSINWRVFGTGNRLDWGDGLVHRQFHRCAWRVHGVNRWFKGLFRRPEIFGKFQSHGPSGFDRATAGADWGAEPLVWVNSAGTVLPDWHPEGAYMRMTPQHLTTHEAAQINHYMLRSEESFSLKRGTLSAAALKDRYTDEFFDRFNRNEAEDTSALRHAAAFDALHARAMTLPGVARLHHLCCADYAARLAARAGRAPEDDPRRRLHLIRAAAAR
ncbi:glycosyltransferase family 2 protein [Frigidibacter oleivorans]|uniref:glycosyltransferase family 2 protein n=1 Tax=Frigidibacter oleivorans TaxID=2487129 RepID=UPI001F4657ED|nr:glycosyltransferase family 2 protein [Frigidibacter oleivorans]